jgi:hypothetical protein
MVWQVGKRSCGAKAAVGRDEPFTLAEARAYARQPTTRMQAGGY